MVTKISMRATIAQMEAGESLAISMKIRGYNSIRNCASLLGSEMGRKYSVAVARETDECIVTRVR